MSLRKIREMINAGDVCIHKEQIGGELLGFVYPSKRGKIHIFVDDSLSPSAEQHTLFHECGHVLLHAHHNTCIIGLDKNHLRENEAEQFAREIQNTAR